MKRVLDESLFLFVMNFIFCLYNKHEPVIIVSKCNSLCVIIITSRMTQGYHFFSSKDFPKKFIEKYFYVYKSWISKYFAFVPAYVNKNVKRVMLRILLHKRILIYLHRDWLNTKTVLMGRAINKQIFPFDGNMRELSFSEQK